MLAKVHHHRLLRIGGLALAVTLCTPSLLRAQLGQPAPVPQERPADVPPRSGGELEPGRWVPVLLGGEPVIWIAAGVGQYTPEARAARITERLDEIVHDRSIPIRPSPSPTHPVHLSCACRAAC